MSTGKVTIKINIEYLQWVTLLKGTETPKCWPDKESQELCCLPRARIHDVAEGVPQLLKSMDYYLLLPYHMWVNKWCYKPNNRQDQGRLLTPGEAGEKHWCPSHLLIVREKGTARSRCIVQINICLHGWCHWEGFAFYNNGLYFNDCSLLNRDGMDAPV